MSLGTERQGTDYAELQNAPAGTVVWDQKNLKYYRKGRRHTWHEIAQADGQRLGYGSDSIYKPYTMVYLMEGEFAFDSAEIERLQNMKREKGARY